VIISGRSTFLIRAVLLPLQHRYRTRASHTSFVALISSFAIAPQPRPSFSKHQPSISALGILLQTLLSSARFIIARRSLERCSNKPPTIQQQQIEDPLAFGSASDSDHPPLADHALHTWPKSPRDSAQGCAHCSFVRWIASWPNPDPAVRRIYGKKSFRPSSQLTLPSVPFS